jgi:hypothetical protein
MKYSRGNEIYLSKGVEKMTKYKTDIIVESQHYHIFMSVLYSPTLGEHLFDIEICDDSVPIYSNKHSIYSKRDAETCIRHVLKCKGKRFTWQDSQ